jgi:histone deacetylase 6
VITDQFQVHCSRYVHGHAELHAIGSEEHPIVGNDHAMALSFSDLSVWCYRCEDYVHHEMMANIKKAVHLAKFGN